MEGRPMRDIERARMFAETWKKHGSPILVAQALGMDVRKVYEKRRKVEALLGVELQTFNDQSDRAKSRSFSATFKRHEGRVDLNIENGTVIVFSDAHYYPGVISTAHRALLSMCRQLKPAAVICNGDAFDGATISRHPRIGWDKKPSVHEELKAVDERLVEIEQAAKGAQFIWCLGNHDARFETFLAANSPQYEGVKGFSLKDHFPRWHPAWSAWINDEAVVKHRWHNGIHATYNNTLKSGKTIVTGHLHRLKVEEFSDYNGRRYGVDCGTLADPYGTQFIDYTEGSPVNWHSGFVVLTFKDGRLLAPELVRKWDEDRVEFRGHLLCADTGKVL